MESADLSGYVIEYRDVQAGDDAPFSLYFTFPEGASYTAGTRVIIRNGEVPATLPDVENVLFYAEHPSPSITFARTMVRLSDTTGEVAHRRVFIRNNGFTSQPIRVIRSQDATRIFVFVEDQARPFSDLPDAAYRLSCTYQRDLGGNELLLRRHGFTQPEETHIEFSLPPLLPG